MMVECAVHEPDQQTGGRHEAQTAPRGRERECEKDAGRVPSPSAVPGRLSVLCPFSHHHPVKHTGIGVRVEKLSH